MTCARVLTVIGYTVAGLLVVGALGYALLWYALGKLGVWCERKPGSWTPPTDRTS